MSDRTQTLSVEVTDDEVIALRCEEGGPSFSSAVRDHRHAVVAKLRKAALSQPEHQGDEAPEPDVDLDPMQGMGAYEAWKDGWTKGRASQLPAPVLSDEEREQLNEVAQIVQDYAPESRAAGDAAFLRNLASQEHRGEETTEVERLRAMVARVRSYAVEHQRRDERINPNWIYAQLEDVEAHETAKAKLEAALSRPCAEADWHGVWVWRDSITGKLQTTTGSSELSTIPPASGMREGCRFYRPQPPAGEVERLREAVKLIAESAYMDDPATCLEACQSIARKALAERSEQRPKCEMCRDSGKGPHVHGRDEYAPCSACGRTPEQAHDLDFDPPPSDSQGDQGQCKRCDGTRNVWPNGYDDKPELCPDCNPAPIQVEGDDGDGNWYFDAPPEEGNEELEAALEDLAEEADREAQEHLKRRDALDSADGRLRHLHAASAHSLHAKHLRKKAAELVRGSGA